MILGLRAQPRDTRMKPIEQQKLLWYMSPHKKQVFNSWISAADVFSGGSTLTGDTKHQQHKIGKKTFFTNKKFPFIVVSTKHTKTKFSILG